MKKALNFKLDLINDVSGLSYDKNTINFLKKIKLPFVLHHMRGTTKTMQINPSYKNVLNEIKSRSFNIASLRALIKENRNR